MKNIYIQLTKIFIGAAMIFSPLLSEAQREYYWNGGTGNWSDLSKWEYSDDGWITSVYPADVLPTMNDNVTFDAASFPIGGQLTIDVDAECNDFYMDPLTGTNSPILYSYPNSLNVYGDFEFATGVYRDIYRINFYADKYIAYLDFGDNTWQNNVNIWWQTRLYFYGNFGYDLNSDIYNANQVYINMGGTGVFYTNDYSLTTQYRVAQYGSGSFFGGFSTIDTRGIVGYATFDAVDTDIYLHTDENGNAPYLYGGQYFGSVTILNGLCNISDNNEFDNLILDAGAGISLQDGTTQSVYNNFTAWGGGRDNLVAINSQTPGNQATIYMDVVSSYSVDYATITDISITDPLMVTPYTATNSFDGGNNTNWIFNTPLGSADFRWIGGTGNWSDPLHWEISTDAGATWSAASEGPAPFDEVFFTTNSFPTGGIVTLDQSVTITNMTWETGSGTSNPEIYSNWPIELTINGDLNMDDGVQRRLNRIIFNSGGGTNNINMADNYNAQGSITFEGGGIANLLSNLANEGYSTEFQDVTFNTNGYSVSSWAFYIYNSSAIMNWGNSDVYLPSGVFNYTTPTFNAETSTFHIGINNIGGTSYINGPLAFNQVILYNRTEIEDQNSFINLTANPGATLFIQDGSSQIVTDTLALQGTRSDMITLESWSGGTFNLTTTGSSSITTDYLNIANCTITDDGLPTAGFDVTATNSIDNGGNYGWDIQPISALYFRWIGGTGNWTDMTHWEESADGATGWTAATVLPGPIDNVSFTTNSFLSGGTITLDQAVTINDMTWEPGSGSTFPEIYGNWSERLTVMGNFTMDNGVSRNIRNITFNSSNGTNIINMADNITNGGNIDFTGSGIWELMSDVSTGGNDMYFNEGTLNTNNYNITFGGGYINSDLTTLNLGSSNIYVLYGLWRNNNPVVNVGTSTFHFGEFDYQTTRMYGGHTLNEVIVTGTLEMYDNNTVTDLTVLEGNTLRINSGTNQTITGTLNLVGSRSSVVNVETMNTPGSATLTVSGATVNADFISISDNNIYEDGLPTVDTDVTATNAIDNGGNTGWDLQPLTAIDLRWIGGTGNWSDLTHWEESTDSGLTWAAANTLPGNVDNVFFTTNSFPTGGTITIDQSVTINDMTWEPGSGSTNPEINGNWDNWFTIKGDLTMDNGVNRRINRLRFDSSNGINNIDMADNNNNNVAGDIFFSGGGTWELQSDLYVQYSTIIEDGTFNTNDFTVTSNYGFSIENDNAIINFGASEVYLHDGIWKYASNPTVNMGTSTIYFGNDWGGTSRMYGQLAYNNVVILGPHEIENYNNTFNSLSVNPGANLRIYAGSTQTVTGALTLQGNRSSLVNVESWGTTGSSNLIVTGATVTADFVSIANNTIVEDGAPSVDADVTATNAIDNGGNIGWDLQPISAIDFRWINGTGNWSDLSHWEFDELGDGSSWVAATFAPGAVDNVIFTTTSFTSGGIITLDQPVTINNMTWEVGSGAANPQIYADWGNRLTIMGDFTMDDGVYREIREMTFDSSNGSNQIYMADNYSPYDDYPYGHIRFEGNGIWNLQGELKTQWSLAFQDGTFNTNDYSIIAESISIDNNATILNFGASNIYLTNAFYNWGDGTFNMGTSTFYFENSWNGNTYIHGSPINFNNVVANNLLRIQNDGNSFVNLTVNPGGILGIGGLTTHTITGALNLNGSRSTLAKVEYYDNGTPGNGILVVTGATVTANYVDISDNTIDNGDPGTDVPATNAIDGGGNTGWALSPIVAIDFRWIGGTGNWSDIAHWEESTDGGTSWAAATTAPGAVDNVFFTTNSFTEIGQVTVDLPVTINDMTWEAGSGAFGPTIYSSWDNTVTIRGNLTMDNGVIRNFERLIIDSSLGNNTIDMADYSEKWGDISFTGDGITNLASDLTVWNFTVEDATVNTNDYTLTIGSFNLDYDHPTLNLGNSNVYIDYAISDWSNTGTLNAGTSTINIERSYSTGISRIRGNPMTFNNVVLSGQVEIRMDNSYNSLTANTGSNLMIFAGSVQTINSAGSLNLIGTRSGLVNIESFDYGTPGSGYFVTTGATVNADFISISDNTIDNGDPGTDVIATNAVDNGNNIGWDLQPITALDYYWIGGEGVWSDIAHWQTSPDGGTTFVAATDPPGAVDNIFFDTNSFPAGGQLTLEETVQCFNMTWSAGSGASFPVIYADWPNELVIHGSLQLADGVARNIYRINFDTDATGNTISMAGSQYGWGDVDFNGTGDWTLLDSLRADWINIRGGTLNTNGQSIYAPGQIYLDWQNTGIINWGASNIYTRRLEYQAQNLTFNAESSTFYLRDEWEDGFALNSGYTINFNNVVFSGRGTINNSHNYNNLTIADGAQVSLQAGSTQSVSGIFTVNGSRGGMIGISSTEAGNPATFAVNTSAGATINFGYAVIQDNIIDNGDAGTDEVANFSVDNGGNTGWDFLSNPLPPLEYYWIGGTGNWSDYTNHWRTSNDAGTTLDASFSPPGVIDNVYFTTNSFPSGGTITLDQSGACNNMTWTDGSFQPTIADQNGSILTIRGNLTIANGVNRSLNVIEFNSGDAGNLISLGDNRGGGSGEFRFRGGGEWSLLDSLAASSINIYSGTFNTLNNPVILTWDLNMHDDGPITINFGSSKVQASNINNWHWTTGTINVDIGTSHFTILDNGRFWGNSMGFYDLTLKGWCYVGLNGGESLSVTNTLTIEPGGTLEIDPYMLNVNAEHLNAIGTRPSPVNIISSEEGMQATLSVPVTGTVTASDIVVKDNNATGGAVFAATEAIDRGNNTGWSFSPITPIDFYWVGGSGNWSDIIHWETSTDGVTFTPATFAPGGVDNVTVDGLKTAAGAMNIDIQAECNTMDWSLAPSGSSLTQDFDANLTVHGSFLLASGVSNSLDNLFFDSDASGNTLDMGDNSGNVYINMEFQGSGDWTLADSLSTFYLNLNSGTLNTGGFPLSTAYLGMDGTGTLNLGSSKVYLNALEGDSTTSTLNAGTSTIYLIDDSEIYNSWLLNDIVVDGEVYIYNANTIGDLIIKPGSILHLSAGDTLVMNTMDAIGVRSQPITIKSTTDGTQAAIQQGSGVVLAQYLTLQDNNAFGGALFVAQNSINNGNVTGWTVNTTSPRDYYWVGGSGKWSEYNGHWSNADGGSNFFDSSPGPLDNVYFTSNSFPSGGTITLDFPVSVNDMDWTGNTASVSITDEGLWDNSLTIGGSLTLANGVSRDFDELNFISNKSGNSIFMADNMHTFNNTYFEGSGDWTLSGDYEAYSTELVGGIFNSNNYNVTSIELYLAYDNESNWGSSNVYTEDFSTVDLNNSSTFSAGTSTFHFAQSYVEGGVRYNNVEVSDDSYFENSNIIINADITGGTLSLNANQAFSNLTLSGGSTIKVGGGTTQTVNLALSLNGTNSDPVSVKSTVEGVSGFFTVPASGTVTATYVHLQDNTANTGGATFDTSNSSDFGNVSGWNGLLLGQTITFSPLNDQGNTAFNVNASTSSGLSASFEIASGSATVSGNTITPTSPGLLGIRAVQGGDATYGNAEPFIRYVHVNATVEPNELGNMKEAKTVLGQPNELNSNEYYAENTLPWASQAAISNTGALAVANGSRVMIWNQIPSSFNTFADALLGHTDYTTDYEDNPSATVFSEDAFSVAFAGDKLIVADRHRVLIWNSLPTGTGAAADVVVGQTDFNSTKRGTSHVLYGKNQDIEAPITVTTWYDNGAGNYKLIVGDGGNNRVLIYNGIPTSNGVPADIVLGQPDFTSSASGNGADDMNFPVHTAVSPGGVLFVADYGNNRVLAFNNITSLTNGASANAVLGQTGFGLSSAGVSGTHFGGPAGVSISRTGKLAITEYDNNRVLIYNSIPANNSVAPDYILGQPDATSNDPNYNSVSGRSLSGSITADWDITENLFVADNENHRLLVYGAADLDVPTVTFTPPTTHVVGTGTTADITLSDRSGVYADLYYRGISSSNPAYTHIPISDGADGTFSINTNDLYPSGEQLGIEYYLDIRDGFGQDASILNQHMNLQVNSGLPITNFGVGSESTNYRMFSVPLNLAQKDANTVFNSVTDGTYDKESLRVFGWTPGGSSATDYIEYNDGFTNIELGKGYFALAASSASVNSGQGSTPSVTSNAPFEMELVSGWNMIGNPYNFGVTIEDIRTASGLTAAEVQNPQGYNGSYSEQTTLTPGEGYFVNNPSTGNVMLVFPVVDNSGGRIQQLEDNTNPLSDKSWEVRFLYEDNEGYEVVLGAVGMEENSISSFDEHDRINPPSFASQPTIEFTHPEFWQTSFKKDKKATADNESWTFTYTAQADDMPEEIYWDNSYFGLSSPNIYLVDKTNFMVVDMHKQDSYEFNHTGETLFEVYFGEDAWENLLPEQLIVQTPYPNPFNDVININVGLPKADKDHKVVVGIYNLMGKQVATITTSSEEGGYYAFKWNGNNNSGQEVPTGIYAYRVIISGGNNQVVTGKIIKE